jgi:hypothetical protein
VTGATGRTGRRVTEVLLAKGEKGRVVGRDAKKLASLAQLGAEPFIGEMGGNGGQPDLRGFPPHSRQVNHADQAFPHSGLLV